MSDRATIADCRVTIERLRRRLHDALGFGARADARAAKSTGDRA